MNANLPPPWCRTRDAAELERERAHLAAMQKREREAIAAGFQVRPKVPETNTGANRVTDREDAAHG